MKKDFNYREIPYNYTSFSDREIVLKYFDEETWGIIEGLRKERVTGRSAKLLFEILGDIFIIDRNPYIFNDFLEHPKKHKRLAKQHDLKLSIIDDTSNPKVHNLIKRARAVDKNFFESFSIEKKSQKKISHGFKTITSPDNIAFSAFHKVSHVTDATDWRVEYPQVILYPDSVEEIAGMVRTASKLDLRIIPRGGGTGLTGGAVPVYKNTAVINTEKLRKISPITTVTEEGKEIPIVEVEAGVITDRVMDYCSDHGYIFATDPTSAWASTIGGNIAENAGGKKCVMWGTAIDNIYSFKIINAAGKTLEVKRQNHPHRKIHPDDQVIFEVYELNSKGEGSLKEVIKLTGTDIRKKGIGKDITNKALGGVPGIQKEGGDGIIVSARFVLYRPFQECRTVCLEFFGQNLINASRAIVDILKTFESNDVTFLTALEHFDEKYETAINYRNKSERSKLPKAVLLIDVESNDIKDLDASCTSLIEMVEKYEAEGFIATDNAMREEFWKDRKNLGAIARHTNAFKLNEDVVIPIESLPDFADFVEMLNIKKDLTNYLQLVNEIDKFFSKNFMAQDTFLPSKIDSFMLQVHDLKKSFTQYIKHINDPVSSVHASCGIEKAVFEYIRDEELLINHENKIITSFQQLFHGYDEMISQVVEIFRHRRDRKIIIATHMHAGDGNIHVNIPVHSSDYEMMLEAEDTAAIIMKKTVELGGVISGEHGIGLTKLKFIDKEILNRYQDYKKKNDPTDLFNPGKLRSDFPIKQIYTPSFNLLEMEAFILEASDLEKLTTSIAPCVRCGKCKEVCNTHFPGGTMFYSPRNKILGVSLITEAVLYEAQTATSLSFRNFKMLRDISDHCTGCHNCYTPCPVNIDFGEVTLAIKELLVERKRSQFKLITWFVLFYLKRRGFKTNSFFRIVLLNMGYTAQRIAHYLGRPFLGITGIVMPKISAILKSPLPRAGQKTVRDHFKMQGSDIFYAFNNPEREVKKSVVYFPGCGSERMFPEISMATIALLYYADVRVVLAPEYLCCGYPLLHNGKVKQAKIKSYENRVIFHRIAETVGYMDIEDVIVSCGTCHEMLSKYQIENIFSGGALIDINEFIAREELYKNKKHNIPLLDHEPCHTPLKLLGADRTFNAVLGTTPVMIPNCCGEGGTLSLSTPEISNELRRRKKLNIFDITGKKGKTTVLTTCPSCVQGLSRIQGDISVKGKSLVLYLAEQYLGKNWKKKFIKDVKGQNGIERIIL